MSSWKQKRTVKRRYDLTAGMYNERYSEEQVAKYRVALAKAEKRGLILDVGCGTGLLFSHIGSEAERIIGVDISKMLLLHAKDRAKALGNVGLIQADADYLPFRNSEFNSIFAFTVLQNLPEPLETMLEIQRTAKIGANVTVTGLKKTLSKEALKTLLRKAGFHVVSMADNYDLKCFVALSLKTSSN